LRILVDILDPVPPYISTSYPPSDYGVYGFVVFYYSDPTLGLYKGKPQWINFRNQIFEPEMAGAQLCKAFFKPNVKFLVRPSFFIPGVPPVKLAGILMNALTGQGLPLP